MTDYQKMYQEKLTTPDKIAQQVQSDWLLGMDTATSQTPAIMTAIAERIRNSDITGVKVQALLDAYPFEFYTDPTLAGKMTGYSWFSSSAARKAVNAGYADIIPAYYRDFPTRIRTEYDYDAVCVEVAPMDRHGYFSLALNGSYIDAMLDKTKRIFLEVNDRQPRGLCGSLIHISQVDAIVEYNHDLPVLPPVQLDEVSKTIGGLIAERIPDGACLQLGIGAIPDATGMALKAKHDLGIHTEMFTDSMVELIECGAVNNSKKQIHRGKTVTTFAFGSQRIYDYIDDNPAVEILPVEYVNDPDVICQNDNMISINAAVEVDLFGQVCAESVGTKHMSGSGGQIDYVRGALPVPRRQELHRLHVHGQGRHDQQDQVHPHPGRRRYDEQERCRLHRHRVRRGASARPQPWRACPPADRHRAPRFPRRADLRGQKARHYDLIPQCKACCPHPTDGRLFLSIRILYRGAHNGDVCFVKRWKMRKSVTFVPQWGLCFSRSGNIV